MEQAKQLMAAAEAASDHITLLRNTLMEMRATWANQVGADPSEWEQEFPRLAERVRAALGERLTWSTANSKEHPAGALFPGGEQARDRALLVGAKLERLHAQRMSQRALPATVRPCWPCGPGARCAACPCVSRWYFSAEPTASTLTAIEGGNATTAAENRR